MGTLVVLTSCKFFGGERGTSTGARTGESSQAVAIQGAPTFGGADTASRGAVIAYARAASYVTDSRLVDEQVLRLPSGTGPRARVQATRYSHMLADSQMARGALIARFVSNGPYAPLGLQRGVQYLFIDSVAGAGWRAIIVDDDSTRAPTVMKMVLTDTPHDYSVPSARWIETQTVQYTFGNPSCGKYCCIPCDDTKGYSCPTGPWPPQLSVEEMLAPPITPIDPLRRPARGPGR